MHEDVQPQEDHVQDPMPQQLELVVPEQQEARTVDVLTLEVPHRHSQ